MTIKLLGIRALSPIHAGTGSGEGAIDLPIIREQSTGIPIIPGSTIKGVFKGDSTIAKAYGDINVAGSLNFGDAYLVLFPVRSLSGVFAWVTSPYLLSRYAKDMRAAGIQLVNNHPIATDGDIRNVTPGNTMTALCAANSLIRIHMPAVPQQPPQAHIILEDVKFSTVRSPGEISRVITSLSILGVVSEPELTERLCIVSDTVMSFLLKTATEIRGRNRIDEETGIVADKALWYEEMLPVETVMSGIVRIVPRQYDVATLVAELQRQTAQTIMFGGKSTVGRGMCHVSITN